MRLRTRIARPCVRRTRLTCVRGARAAFRRWRDATVAAARAAAAAAAVDATAAAAAARAGAAAREEAAAVQERHAAEVERLEGVTTEERGRHAVEIARLERGVAKLEGVVAEQCNAVRDVVASNAQVSPPPPHTHCGALLTTFTRRSLPGKRALRTSLAVANRPL